MLRDRGGAGSRQARLPVPAVTHDSFCYEPRGACYFLTCTCQCHGKDASRPARKELTCWGVETGSKANAVCNLIWLTVLIGAVVYAIVSLA